MQKCCLWSQSGRKIDLCDSSMLRKTKNGDRNQKILGISRYFHYSHISDPKLSSVENVDDGDQVPHQIAQQVSQEDVRSKDGRFWSSRRSSGED